MQKIKNQLEELISRLNTITPDAKQLKKAYEKLTQEHFNLVIIGQFKRGKSTFINALLGEKIVPSSILPLTSIVTIISYSPNRFATVKFKDKSTKKIAIDDISLYVTEKHNPENKLNVQEVWVYHPSEYLKKGIRIVDTPGIGSVFKHNTDVAYNFLPYCDAAIFVMSPDPPLGEAEIEFLKNAKAYTEKFFFVLNKIDIVSEDELKEVVEFNRELLKQYTQKDINIYPVSAKDALFAKLNNDPQKLNASNIKAIEKDLDRFIETERFNIIAISTINILLRHINNELTSYKIQIQTQKMSVEQLKSKIDEFAKFIKTIEEEAEEYNYILDKRIEKIYAELDEEIEKLKEKYLPVLIENMQKHFSELSKQKLSTEEFEEKMTQKMNSYIVEIFSEWRKKQSDLISMKVEAIYEDLASKINSKIKQIIQSASELFEVELNAYIDKEKLSKKSDFYFMLEDQMGILNIFATTFRTKLPFFIGKRIAAKHIRKTTEELFDRHCGRVRYDLTKRVRETTFAFKDQLKEKLQLTIESIDKALERSLTLKDQNEQEVEAKLKQIQENTRKLTQIKEELETIKSSLNQ